jgi:hypothetical protein
MDEGSRTEGSELPVELGTDPADLGLGDTGLEAEGGYQVVDLPGRNPVHVGLDDHGEQGPVDATTALQDGGEEAALAELRDLQVHVSGFCRQQPITGPVALGGPGAGPLKSLGSDLGGGAHGLQPDGVAHGGSEMPSPTRLGHELRVSLELGQPDKPLKPQGTGLPVERTEAFYGRHACTFRRLVRPL